MSIDVIIPTYRPDRKFDLLLKRLFMQSMLPRCIYILNTQAYPEFAGTFMEEYIQKILPVEKQQVEVRLIQIPECEFNHGGTRRLGAALSDADFLLFMTQDAVPENSLLLKRLHEACSGEGVGASYARQITKDHAGRTERYSRAFNYPKISSTKSMEDIDVYGIKTYFCSNVCAMYRTEVYRELGGFVEKTIFNEDMIFAHKLIHSGYMIAYEAEARVIHSHQYGWMQQFHRNFDLGVSQAQFPDVFCGKSSEAEGMSYVKAVFSYLINEKAYIDMADFFFESGFKYAGYLLGRNYRWIPRRAVLFCSMNKSYWDMHE